MPNLPVISECLYSYIAICILYFRMKSCCYFFIVVGFPFFAALFGPFLWWFPYICNCVQFRFAKTNLNFFGFCPNNRVDLWLKRCAGVLLCQPATATSEPTTQSLRTPLQGCSISPTSKRISSGSCQYMMGIRRSFVDKDILEMSMSDTVNDDVLLITGGRVTSFYEKQCLQIWWNNWVTFQSKSPWSHWYEIWNNFDIGNLHPRH